ncbi:hypothetical protein GCM10027403_28170 [Arthrobacter tecti]
MGPADPFPSEQGSLLEGTPPTFPTSVPATNDAAVNELMAGLADIADLDQTAQPAAYERLHDDLLAELNSDQD